MVFKDHFSTASDQYQFYRPRYPDALFAYLVTLCQRHDAAWDCATGSGQAAADLAQGFTTVYATDASANQIRNATSIPNVIFSVATAEHSGLPDGSVDLVTVAQALHWFDVDAFASEVRRVARPGGLLSAWSYNLFKADAAVDELINRLYRDILGEYWPAERRHVETAYTEIELPFEEIAVPAFVMSSNWNLHNLVGYLQTWSATRRYEQATTRNPVTEIYADLLASWGEPTTAKPLNWPLNVRVWRIT